MKGKKRFFLCCVIFLFLTACKSDIETIPSDEAKKKQHQSSHTEVEDSQGKEETLESEVTMEDSLHTEPWEQAYLDYLDAFEVSNSCTYSLIYVDEDEIPELVIDTGIEAGGCQILTWHEEVLDVLQTSRLYFTYIEKGNLLCNSEGHMGYYYDYVFTIKDGLWEFVGGGTYSDPADGPKFDESGEFVYEYHWLEQPVEKAEYEQKFHAVYPENDGKTPEIYYIKDEMYSVLKTGETTSAKHHYELIVEDLTWTEAYKACEEKGGYLATLTSHEEFERVQEQILSEDKGAITFFVGADRVSGFGFSWLEPGKPEGYSMLGLYNALFKDFWLDGEPSYSGLTEDGKEVKEEYVSILYRSADGRCYLNDVPEDILSAIPSYAGQVGYICEYDE